MKQTVLMFVFLFTLTHTLAEQNIMFDCFSFATSMVVRLLPYLITCAHSLKESNNNLNVV